LSYIGGITIPSLACSVSTPISGGLFAEKKRGGKKKEEEDRNPFVKPGCVYLHGDEGPECSNGSQTIEPVFVLPREV